MDRQVPRVEPVPVPFVLPADLAAASPLHRRLVLLALPDDEDSRRVAADLVARPGVHAPAPGSQLFAQGLDVPWRQFQVSADVGLGPMVSAREFLTALRGLADDLLAAAAGDGVLLDWSPEHATPDAVQAGLSVFPDATVIVRPDLAAALPADVRDSVIVVPPGDQAPSLPATPPSAGPAPRPAASPSPRQDRLIVVVGCGRSGTTWLEQLFLAHPRVGGVPRSESWIFQQLHRLWLNFDSGSGVAGWVDAATFAAALRRYCDALFTAALARHSPDADYFVEKTPMHSYRLREIAAVYPDAWVVHLLRDGRDVARSIAQVPFFGVPDPGDAAEMWQRVVAAVRHDAGAVPRFRELRYERLYDDPAATMTEALGWMGLGVDGPTATELRAAAGERVSTHAGTAGQVGSGSWRSLPAADVARIHRRAADQLIANGYARRRDVWRATARAALRRGDVHA